MTRDWFQDADGTYYRNCPLVLAEMGPLRRLFMGGEEGPPQ